LDCGELVGAGIFGATEPVGVDTSDAEWFVVAEAVAEQKARVERLADGMAVLERRVERLAALVAQLDQVLSCDRSQRRV
jgi:hypothetical protein